MQKLPKISIVIPSYNKVKYIRETLQSIVNQKYPDLEVIIMDGGSTDGTLDVIKKYAKKYPKLFFVESKKDKGQTDAINKGFKKATGDVFAFINADDLYDRGALLRVGHHFAKNNPVWLSGEGKVIDDSGKEIVSWVTKIKSRLLHFNKYGVLLIVNYLMQPSTFISMKALRGVKLFGTGRVVLEYDLWLKLAKNCMPDTICFNLSFFRLTSDTFSSSKYGEILGADYKISQKYTSNQLILFLHKTINTLRILFV